MSDLSPGCTCGRCDPYTPPQGMCAGALAAWRDEMAAYAIEDTAAGDFESAAKSAESARALAAELLKRGVK